MEVKLSYLLTSWWLVGVPNACKSDPPTPVPLLSGSSKKREKTVVFSGFRLKDHHLYPNLAQHGSKLSQLGPACSQLGPRWPQLGTTWPQHGFNFVPKTSTWTQTWHSMRGPAAGAKPSDNSIEKNAILATIDKKM